MQTDRTAPGLSIAASSVAEEVRRHVGSIALVPAEGLEYWLPHLSLPAGWAVVPAPQEQALTRMALRRGTSEDVAWDGCEVIGLYRFVGPVPDEVVRNSADRTLRDLDARNIRRDDVSLPPDVSGKAVRSSGSFLLGKVWVWGQFANYLIDAGSALVEHSVLVRAPLRARLARDINELTANVCRSLVASVVAAQRSSDL